MVFEIDSYIWGVKMKLTALQRTDSTGRIINSSLGFGIDELKAGSLGGAKVESSIWDVPVDDWHEDYLSRLRYHTTAFSLLAAYIQTCGCEDTKKVWYASNGPVKVICVDGMEYRTRNVRGRQTHIFSRESM